MDASPLRVTKASTYGQSKPVPDDIDTQLTDHRQLPIRRIAECTLTADVPIDTRQFFGQLMRELLLPILILNL